MGMKYLIIGSGGTGGCIGAFLESQGENVTFIARGPHLRALRDHGLRLDSGVKGEMHIPEVNVYAAYEYEDKADVIFVCVKGYSLEAVIPLIEKAAHRGTVVIPILNLFGTGEYLDKRIKGCQVLDACIYMVGYVSKPGVLVQSGKICKLVYGPRKDQIVDEKVMAELKEVLETSDMKVLYSKDIKKDTFEKFSFISSCAACGAYYDVVAKAMQTAGEIRDFLACLQQEVKNVGEAMGLVFEEGLTVRNMRLVDALLPETTASMQKDLRAGKQSEIDGLVFEVVRLGEKLGVAVPYYQKVMEKFS